MQRRTSSLLFISEVKNEKKLTILNDVVRSDRSFPQPTSPLKINYLARLRKHFLQDTGNANNTLLTLRDGRIVLVSNLCMLDKYKGMRKWICLSPRRRR